MKKKYLEVGKIVSTHGLKGEVRVEPWCDSPEFLCQFKSLYLNEQGDKIKVMSSRRQKNIVIMNLSGINTIEQADAMRGKVLYIDRNDVKMNDGVYFVQDIIDIEVYDIDTDVYYGNVTEVFKTGANDVYQVTDKQGKDYLMPVIPDVVINTDIDDNKMYIRPIKGIFSDED